jgi:hypothetical protein
MTMDKSDERLKQLSRSDQIREESKRALEFGQAPKRPLSLNANFRVAGLTAAPRPHCSPESAPSEAFLNSSRVKIVSSSNSNPLIPKVNPRYLAEQIEYELQRAGDPQRAGKLLDLMSNLTSVDPNSQTTGALRRRVFTHVFGERYFESERDLPKERGTRGRGSSLFTSKGKDA